MESELETLKRATASVDKVEKDNNKAQEEAIEAKLNGLKDSLETLQSQVDLLTQEVQELDNDKDKESAAAEKKEELSTSITKLGNVLESMESQLKEKLVFTRAKIEAYLSEMKRLREQSTAAKATVTAVQSEIIECQQKRKKVCS